MDFLYKKKIIKKKRNLFIKSEIFWSDLAMVADLILSPSTRLPFILIYGLRDVTVMWSQY